MRRLLHILLANQVVAALLTLGFTLVLGPRQFRGIGISTFVFTNGVGTAVQVLFLLLDRSEIYGGASPFMKNLARVGAVGLGTILGVGAAVLVLRVLFPPGVFEVAAVLSLTAFSLLVATVITTLHFLLGRLKQGIEQKAIEIQKLREVEAQTRLMALQSKVDPHFLFNTLNTMLSLVRKSPDEVETLILALSDLYRRVLQLPDNALIPVSEEMELIGRYLEIERIRLGPRLAFVLDLDPGAASRRILPMLVEPLVGNALKHGIGPRPEGGRIRVEVRDGEGAVHIRVEDDGAGLSGPGGGGGFGLYSIRERLRLFYGDRASLTIHSEAGHGFRAELAVPHD